MGKRIALALEGPLALPPGQHLLDRLAQLRDRLVEDHRLEEVQDVGVELGRLDRKRQTSRCWIAPALVDLGSGAGFDAILCGRKVGPTGRVIGIDMTPEMLQKARANAARLGLKHVEFREGVIEDLPLRDGVADVVISNCVINLSTDKGKALGEAFRVLKPGGRLRISDVVTTRPISAEARLDREA